MTSRIAVAVAVMAASILRASATAADEPVAVPDVPWTVVEPSGRATEGDRSKRVDEFEARAEEEAQQKAYWQSEYREAIRAERDARARLEAAEAAWTRGRRDNRLRGDEKAAALAELEAARAALAEARSDLAALPERAREAGALPGWLREVELSTGAPPARPGADR